MFFLDSKMKICYKNQKQALSADWIRNTAETREKTGRRCVIPWRM